MKDIKMDDNGDYVHDEVGNPIWISGKELATQINVQWMRELIGDWYGSPSSGFPYFEMFLDESIPLDLKIRYLRRYILSHPINQSFQKFDFDIIGRLFKLEYIVTTTIGNANVNLERGIGLVKID